MLYGTNEDENFIIPIYTELVVSFSLGPGNGRVSDQAHMKPSLGSIPITTESLETVRWSGCTQHSRAVKYCILAELAEKKQVGSL